MSPRTLAGVAALAYVAGVAIENMEILEAPTIGSSATEIRAAYADQAFMVVTSLAGALALLAYLVLAAALFALLRERERPGEPWAIVGLIGGIGGPAIAAVGLAANALLVASRAEGLSDELTTALLDLYLTARIVSAIFVALFLLGFGIAALRTRALPRVLGAYACALAAPLALAPLAAFTGDDPLRIAVSVAFGLQTLWIFLLGIWLSLADDVAPRVLLRRAAFLLLALAAGLVGLGLLAAPGASGRFFSWGLGPEPLAAFAGGVYVGSALVYALAVNEPWQRVRGLVAAAVLLSVSVFVITLTHLDQFDLDRLQAWAWIVLFAGFSALTFALLAVSSGEPDVPAGAPLDPAPRIALGVVSALLAALAVGLWVDPTALSGPSPFELPPLGGRFAGSWVALLALLAGVAAVHARADLARPAALALVALPAAAAIAALRTISDLEPAGAAVAYVAALAALCVAGIAILRSLRPRPA